MMPPYFIDIRVAVQAAFAEATEMTWGEPGVDSLRAKLRAKQGDLQLSMAAADSVVKETIRWEAGWRSRL